MRPGRRAAAALAALTAAGLIAACTTSTAKVTAAKTAATVETLWPTSTVPGVVTDADTGAVELGTTFTAAVSGQVTGVTFYKGPKNLGTHTVNLWTAAGTLVRSHVVTGETGSGWQTMSFGTPLPIVAGATYTASYFSPKGHYSDTVNYAWPRISGDLGGTAGTYTYGASSKFPTSTYQRSSYFVSPVFVPDAAPSPTPTVTPSPTPTPSPTVTPSPTPSPTATPTPTPSPTPSSGGFPDGSNTGVPPGTVLTDYTGPGTVSGTVTGQRLTGDFGVSGTATISDSVIDGSIKTTGSGTLSLIDDTVLGEAADEGNSVIFGANISGLRLDVHGGKANFQCQDNCSIVDSWLHDPFIENAYHYDMIGSNGMSGFTIRHNTISCTNHTHAASFSGGCSADMGFFGDFDVIQNITVDHNLFVASSDSAGYCVITNATKPGKAFPTGRNLVYTNNVWQRGSNGRCGQFGPVDNWQSGNGNVWSGNSWDDGTPLNE